MQPLVVFVQFMMFLQYAMASDDDGSGDVKLPPPSFTDCNNALDALDMDFLDFARYPVYFRDDSELTLPNAGTYRGPVDIEEYMNFATIESPHIKEHDTLKMIRTIKSVNEMTGVCSFVFHRVSRYEMNSATARKATFLNSVMLKISYDYNENYVSRVAVFFTPEWNEFFFGNILNTEQTKEYICSTSGSCQDTNVGMSRHECIQRLDDLPKFSNDDNKSFDGLDYGCRALHSVFALKNPGHCPHISFEPQEDPKGNIKCQHSKNLQSLDYFSQDEIQDFMDFLESPASLIESTYGYKVLDMPRDDINPKRIVILFGIVTPVVLFIFVYTLQRLAKNKENAHNEATSSDEKDVNALFSDKARQLSIIMWIVVSTLVLVNGLAAVVVWKIGQNHPEWIRDNDGDISLEDKFLSEPSTSLAETVPQAFLDDEQFAIYSGFVVWVTCLISGFGLEVFVWYHFLQVWCDEREGLWRFAQFIFPLMLVTALILALQNNALALPIMVAGLWKFGFPETLMYLYLGKTFTTTASRNYYYRLSDFLNGIGTVLHHGAASMILSMMVVGVIPSSRYVLNCTLILTMQHWVVLLAYKNLALYSAMELTLEYFFEWVILSDFSQIYNLHWTAALGASVMLFSHWLYIIAGVLGSISWYEDNDPALNSSSKNGTKNVHTRGQKLMSKDSQKISTRRKSSLLDGTRSPSAWELRNVFSSEMMMVEENNTCLVGLMIEEEEGNGSSERTQKTAEAERSSRSGVGDARDICDNVSV